MPNGPANQELMEFARNELHVWSNHLQVISGWLKIGRPDRALDYVTTVINEVEVERDIIRTLDPSLAALFLSRLAAARCKGIELVVDCHDTSADIGSGSNLVAILQELLDKAIYCLSTRGTGSIVVRNTRDEGLPSIVLELRGSGFSDELLQVNVSEPWKLKRKDNCLILVLDQA